MSGPAQTGTNYEWRNHVPSSGRKGRSFALVRETQPLSCPQAIPLALQLFGVSRLEACFPGPVACHQVGPRLTKASVLYLAFHTRKMEKVIPFEMFHCKLFSTDEVFTITITTTASTAPKCISLRFVVCVDIEGFTEARLGGWNIIWV